MVGVTDAPLCGDYSAYITDRVGRTIFRLPMHATAGTWQRNLDATSRATVVISGAAADAGCCEVFSTRIDAWGCELVIDRNSRRVWQGPIQNIVDDGDDIALSALDRSAWWYQRDARQDHNWSNVDAALVLEELLGDADADDPAGLVYITSPTGVLVTKVIVAADGVNIGRTVDELARSAIDWTIVGRRAYIGQAETPAPRGAPLRRSHWESPGPTVTKAGDQVATRVTVRGSSGVVGSWPPGPITPDVFYGLHMVTVSEPTIAGHDEATAAARTRWERGRRTPMFVTTAGASLNATAPVDPESLIPGAVFPVAPESCIVGNVVIPMRLHAVAAAWTTGGVETSMKVDLQPVGTVNGEAA